MAGQIDIRKPDGMLQLYRAIEWFPTAAGYTCPRCLGVKPAHEDGCELAAAIDLEGELIAIETAEEISTPKALTDPDYHVAFAEIRRERRRQIEEEGWTPGHDDTHSVGQLALGAAAYAAHAAGSIDMSAIIMTRARELWPWSSFWWKPKNAERDLVRAGALIVAELQRLYRAKAKQLERG